MPVSLLHVQMRPQLHLRVAHSGWDSESSTFTCTVRPLVPVEPTPPSLAERINESLHIEPREFRVVLGDIDIILDNDRQPKSIEVYTNPDQWKACAIVNDKKVGEDEKVDLEVDYDKNNIASIDIPVRIEHDSIRKRLLFRFGSAVSTWHRLADGLLIGLDQESALAAILCERVNMQE